jgi:hypothetical protein
MDCLLKGFEVISIKCTKYPDETNATMTFYAAEDILGYVAGQEVTCRPMTSSERFNYLPQRRKVLNYNNN